MLTVGLILCLAFSSSSRLIASSTIRVYADTIPTLESVKLLIPKGFILLTEEGARNALKAKVDAETYYLLLSESDKALLKANSQVVILTLQNTELKEIGRVNVETIKALKGKLFWSNFWKWSSGAVNVLLLLKLSQIL